MTTRIMLPNDDEVCPYDCDGRGTMGSVSVEHPAYFGGYIGADGKRHDPCIHHPDCPARKRKSEVAWLDSEIERVVA